MADLTYREAVARGIAQEMQRDESVVLIGEDVAGAGGVFKTTAGLLDEFGPKRVIDTPISEQAILGAAMGAAMTGLRPIAEIMFSDFFAVCWDIVVNEIAKTRYMTDGQVTHPAGHQDGNGGGLRFGAQHSQSIENWAMAIPGLKVVAPSTPEDVVGLMAAAVRDRRPRPLLRAQGPLLVQGRGARRRDRRRARHGPVRRQGKDATIVALGMMVQRALAAAEQLAERGIDVEVIDMRSLVPLDAATILESARPHGAALHRRGEPPACWAGAPSWSPSPATTASGTSTVPIVRITTPHIPLASADSLEDLMIPSVDRIRDEIEQAMKG